MKLILIAAMFLAAGQTYAQGDKSSLTPQAKWEAECGSCHIAYPARFLTPETWQRLMDSLDRHFGDNASIDSATQQEILQYLKRNASASANRSAKSMRISDTSWFTHEHDEISGKAWTDPAIKSRANCTACHVNAVRGDWSERGVRMPAGLRNEGDEDDDD
ncbi:MAG TPA: cytochrome C [Gallionellaceae bacterium]